MIDIQAIIPDNYMESENREGYEVTAEMKAVWLKQMELLLKFIEICRKYGFSYSVMGGTLLGTIRHNGYIPWDDDIDVLMKRDEYERFCGIASEELRDPFFLQTEYSDPGSYRLHAQLRNSDTTAIMINEIEYGFKFNQGIFIDIFPLDIMDDRKIVRIIDKKVLHILWAIGFYTSTFTTRYNERKSYSLWKVLLHKILSVVNYDKNFEKKAFRIFENYLSRHKNGDNVYVYALHSPRFIWKSELYEAFVEHKFEFINVLIPTKYDEILKTTYGDWHKPVRGTAVHGNVLFDVTKPYKDYLKEYYEKNKK